VSTTGLLAVMLRSAPKVSDLIFSPGRPPQIEVNGRLIAVNIRELPVLTVDDTRRIAGDLLGNNKQALSALRELGSCDVSYSVPGMARFRANIFIQRGTCAIVMRAIPQQIPDFESLGLPAVLAEIAHLRSGIVLVTGSAGCGKSSTIAAIMDRINEQHSYHVITIEDPLEFLHNHKRCTFHQRELHSDTPTFALGLRAALRQAPKVIFVSEMRDRETMETLLDAAETGHLVLSTMLTTDATKTVERIVGAFPSAEHAAVRNRLARSFRFIVSQRLIPRKDGDGRVPAFEILRSTHATRQCIENGENCSLLGEIIAGAADGMQSFDDEISKLISGGLIDEEDGLAYATSPTELRERLAGQ
jgi:twitching motility protein PilT